MASKLKSNPHRSVILKLRTREQFEELLAYRRYRDLYYFIDENKKYIGIDNSKGECLIKEFDNIKSCKRWLIKDYSKKQKTN